MDTRIRSRGVSHGPGAARSVAAAVLGLAVCCASLLAAGGARDGAEGTDGSTVGFYDPATATWYLANHLTGTTEAITTPVTVDHQAPGTDWLPVAGDWTGGGQETIGLYDPTGGTYYGWIQSASGSGQLTAMYTSRPPPVGWQPVAGNWTGGEDDAPGFYQPSTGVWTTATGQSFTMSPWGSGWTPLAGDWDGNGTDSVGLYDPTTSTFYLRNSNTDGSADNSFGYGTPGAGWQPLVGDWNQDGTDTIGLYNPATSTFHLRNSNSAGEPDQSFTWPTTPGGNWRPLAGNWDGCASNQLHLGGPGQPAVVRYLDGDGTQVQVTLGGGQGALYLEDPVGYTVQGNTYVVGGNTDAGWFDFLQGTKGKLDVKTSVPSGSPETTDNRTPIGGLFGGDAFGVQTIQAPGLDFPGGDMGGGLWFNAPWSQTTSVSVGSLGTGTTVDIGVLEGRTPGPLNFTAGSVNSSAFTYPGPVGKLTAGSWPGATDIQIGGAGGLYVQNGDFNGQLHSSANVGQIAVSGGNFTGSAVVEGTLGKVTVSGGTITHVDGQSTWQEWRGGNLWATSFQVQNCGSITTRGGGIGRSGHPVIVYFRDACGNLTTQTVRYPSSRYEGHTYYGTAGGSIYANLVGQNPTCRIGNLTAAGDINGSFQANRIGNVTSSYYWPYGDTYFGTQRGGNITATFTSMGNNPWLGNVTSRGGGMNGATFNWGGRVGNLQFQGQALNGRLVRSSCGSTSLYPGGVLFTPSTVYWGQGSNGFCVQNVGSTTVTGGPVIYQGTLGMPPTTLRSTTRSLKFTNYTDNGDGTYTRYSGSGTGAFTNNATQAP